MTEDSKMQVATRAADIAEAALAEATQANERAVAELARAQFYMAALAVLLEPLGGTMVLHQGDTERFSRCSLISTVNEDGTEIEITLVRGQS